MEPRDHEEMDRDRTTVYTLLDIADPTIHSTPANRGAATTPARATSNLHTLLETIDFDAPNSSFDDRAIRRRTQAINDRPSKPSTLESFRREHECSRTNMKPGKFDGTGSLETFLAQFELCARYNQWSEDDKVDYLRCALDKAATQLLWDFGARDNVTYEDLVDRLQQRYGAEGQAETFRAQLYYRRQRSDETLSDLLHDIRRLVVLAYPVPSNATTEILARDAFLESIRDRELSLRVREREPRTIDEAY